MNRDSEPRHVISYIRPHTGERIYSPPLTEKQGKEFWEKMAWSLKETAIIEDLKT